MITDPTAVRFDNERIRPMADQLAQQYYRAKALVNDWNDRGMAALLPPGSALIVADGAQTDGRTQVTADDCYGIVLRAQDFVTTMEANGGAFLASVLKVAVNSVP